MRILAENRQGRFTFKTWDAYKQWAATAGHHTVVTLTLIGGEAT